MKLKYKGHDESNFWLAFSSTTCYFLTESKTYKPIISNEERNRVKYEKRVAFFLEIFRRRVDIYTPLKWSKFWANL